MIKTVVFREGGWNDALGPSALTDVGLLYFIHFLFTSGAWFFGIPLFLEADLSLYSPVTCKKRC